MIINTLKTFLEDVANAIRTKSGNTDTIKAYDFPAAIAALDGDVTITGTPIECSTDEEMNAALAASTESSVGTIYKFIGTTSDTYENGALYILEESEVE